MRVDIFSIGKKLAGALLAGAIFFVIAHRVLAAGVEMSQSILPVKFVYLKKSGEVAKIWSNVSEKDDLYVVKFFDASSGLEVSANTRISYFYEEIKKLEAEMSMADHKKSFKIEFVKNNDGGIGEEVRTFC